MKQIWKYFHKTKSYLQIHRWSVMNRWEKQPFNLRPFPNTKLRNSVTQLQNLRHRPRLMPLSSPDITLFTLFPNIQIIIINSNKASILQRFIISISIPKRFQIIISCRLPPLHIPTSRFRFKSKNPSQRINFSGGGGGSTGLRLHLLRHACFIVINKIQKVIVEFEYVRKTNTIHHIS